MFLITVTTRPSRSTLKLVIVILLIHSLPLALLVRRALILLVVTIALVVCCPLRALSALQDVMVPRQIITTMQTALDHAKEDTIVLWDQLAKPKLLVVVPTSTVPLARPRRVLWMLVTILATKCPDLTASWDLIPTQDLCKLSVQYTEDVAMV